MAKEATRMSTLVNDLLSLTRIERIEHSPPSETVELGKILQEVEQICIDRNLFKKIKKLNTQRIDYFISDRYLNLGDIIEVYSKSILYLFKVIMLSRNKSFFINNRDCFNVLYPLLLNSFAGNMQSYILQSLAIKNFFDSINSMGNIPVSLGSWEMTGNSNQLKIITNSYQPLER